MRFRDLQPYEVYTHICWIGLASVQTAIPFLREPAGIPHLSAYVHSKGLKFGLYSARCRYTCQKNAGSFGHEYLDAAQWAEWELDYIKLDECYGGPNRTDPSCHDLDPSFVHRLSIMRDALNATGRPIFFSNEAPAAMQNYPRSVYNATWFRDTYGKQMPSLANMWRIHGDISAHFASVLANADGALVWAKLSAPGAINDCDMLEIGNGMSAIEDESHFAMWCMLAAPLLAGNDLTTMSKHTLDTLTAPELIAVNQDALVEAATVVDQGGDSGQVSWQVWSRPLSDGRKAILLLNRDDHETLNVTVSWSTIPGLSPTETYAVRDLRHRKDLGAYASSFTAKRLAPHESVVVAVSSVPTPKYT